MSIFLLIYIFMFFMGLIVFASKRKHLLLMLLSLEFIVLSLYMNMFMYLCMMDYEIFFSLIFLTMSVCESALGLSVLVLMVRTHGNDYVLSFTSLW